MLFLTPIGQLYLSSWYSVSLYSDPCSQCHPFCSPREACSSFSACLFSCLLRVVSFVSCWLPDIKVRVSVACFYVVPQGCLIVLGDAGVLHMTAESSALPLKPISQKRVWLVFLPQTDVQHNERLGGRDVMMTRLSLYLICLFASSELLRSGTMLESVTKSKSDT